MICEYCGRKASSKDGIGLVCCSECKSALIGSSAQTPNRRRRTLLKYYAGRIRFMKGQQAVLREGMRYASPLAPVTPHPVALTASPVATQRLQDSRAAPGVTYDRRKATKPYLARFQINEVKQWEYFETCAEAVAWLTANNPNYRKRP